MDKVVLYFNSQCKTCRTTKELIDSQENCEVEVVEYMKEVPDEATLRRLLTQLDMKAIELIRKKNYEALSLPPTEDEDELIRLMLQHPEIIQRPIVIVGEKAKVCRPAVSVLDILPGRLE